MQTVRITRPLIKFQMKLVEQRDFEDIFLNLIVNKVTQTYLSIE